MAASPSHSLSTTESPATSYELVKKGSRPAYLPVVESSAARATLTAEIMCVLTGISHLLQPPFQLDPIDSGLSPFYAQLQGIHLPHLNCVKDWLPGAEAVQSQYGAKVSELVEALAEALFTAQTGNEIILQHKSILSSRRKLPAEILAMIFSLAIDQTSHIGDSVSRERFSETLYLTWVCRAWRDCLIGDVRFWRGLLDVTLPMWIQEEILQTLPGSEAHIACKRRAGLRSSVDAVKLCLSRTGSSLLDIVFAGDDNLTPEFLQSLVDASSRWRRLDLRCPDMINTDHVLAPLMEQLDGRLQHLKTLHIDCHIRSWRGSRRLWQGDRVTPEDVLPWFASTSDLDTVIVDTAFFPEETILLPWAKLRSYTEMATIRPGQSTLPLSHLETMSMLVELHLINVWPPNKTARVLTIATLEKLHMELEWRKPSNLPNYDRLEALRLPALKWLRLAGLDFGEQTSEDGTEVFDIAANILHLNSRSMLPGSSHTPLCHLSLCVTTGIQDVGCLLLLQRLSLKELVITEVASSVQGVLMQKFMEGFSDMWTGLEKLVIQRALGYPATPFFQLVDGEPWMAAFKKMVEVHFNGSLLMIDLRPYVTDLSSCVFPEEFHGAWRSWPTNGNLVVVNSLFITYLRLTILTVNTPHT
ncbi:hypothetical protein B0H17DRAFT_1140262 [Mycena rosella]|uniref:F-box domain-containing protein n=1 Tax=Mycena rosella TaxID=1033263 RepID=A0AAD7GA90_MYCRO|nr:hypothetical protein B0H17DRAFT_1140262 [Mycena rosella]